MKLAFYKTTKIKRRGRTFERIAETKDEIYFGDPMEGDDNGNTMIFSKETRMLLSDNIHSTNSFITDALEGNFTWVNPDHKAGIKELIENYC